MARSNKSTKLTTDSKTDSTNNNPDNNSIKNSNNNSTSNPETPMHKPINLEGKFVGFKDTIKDKSTLYAIIIIFIIIILLICLVVFFFSIEPKKTILIGETVKINKTGTYYVSYNVSFANLTNITDQNIKLNLTLYGHLREEKVFVNNVVTNIDKYVVDDYNNKLKIYILGYSNTNDYNKYFITNITTTQYFQVKGTLRYAIYGLVLEVSQISISDQPSLQFENLTTEDTIVQKNITVNSTLNITYGLNKILCLFACKNN